MKTRFYSNGKLLITSEYGVLDGALALAVPTTYGQSLEVTTTDSKIIHWQSFDENGEVWFDSSYDSKTMGIRSYSNRELAETLGNILLKSQELNPRFNSNAQGYHIISKLTFPRNWGLGSSSTLINNIAEWAEVNPYDLLGLTFGGSGYDIACAQHDFPILYTLKSGEPMVEKISFNPCFKNQLYFVFLDQKQNSRKAIANYRKQSFDTITLVNELTSITKRVIGTNTLSDFESIMVKHERLLSEVLKIRPVKERLFPDYFGAVKSLGGWGGDFVLATGNEKTPSYFKAKGFEVVIPFGDMVL